MSLADDLPIWPGGPLPQGWGLWVRASDEVVRAVAEVGGRTGYVEALGARLGYPGRAGYHPARVSRSPVGLLPVLGGVADGVACARLSDMAGRWRSDSAPAGLDERCADAWRCAAGSEVPGSAILLDGQGYPLATLPPARPRWVRP